MQSDQGSRINVHFQEIGCTLNHIDDSLLMPCVQIKDGGFNAYDFKAEDEEEDADMEKLKALAGMQHTKP